MGPNRNAHDDEFTLCTGPVAGAFTQPLLDVPLFSLEETFTGGIF